MMLVLKKKTSVLLPCFCASSNSAFIKTLIFVSTHHHNLSSSISLGFSTIATTTTNDQPTQTSFIVDFLVKSCGLSSPRATKVSKALTHLKSTSNPEKVFHFLKQSGFTDGQIKKCIIWRPRLLCSNVEKTLEPKLKALQELGFSQPELIQLASENPVVFQVCDLRPKIEFWRAVLGANEKILKAFKRNKGLLGSSTDTKIMPNILLLRECGVSDDQLAQLIVTTPRLVTQTIDTFKEFLSRVDALGIPRCSGMYCYAVHALHSNGEASIDKKVKLLMRLGFSKAEIDAAVQKFPNLLTISERKICSLMSFFLNVVGCKPSYVAQRPVLLTLSLEKRLFPRHHVLQMLKRRGFLSHRCGLYTAFNMNEERFMQKFVFPNQEKVSGLHEAYLTACQGKVPVYF